MTHTLHRRGSEESLSKDYVVLVMSSRGFNVDGAAPKLKKALEIMWKYGMVNVGDMKQGSIKCWGNDYERIQANITDRAVLQGVYSDLDKVKAVAQELKNADLGLSVVISGLFDNVWHTIKKVGLLPHTVAVSMETWGRTDLLPPPKIMEIMTMCGHAMISRELVEDTIEKIRTCQMSPEQGSERLAHCCVCGIFNTERCAGLLREAAGFKPGDKPFYLTKRG
jgi:hypothetical protein